MCDETGQLQVCVAATNRLDVLDDALCRPGRFDRVIHVGKPSPAGRQAVLQVFRVCLLSLPPPALSLPPSLSAPPPLSLSVARESLGVEAKKEEKERRHPERDRRCSEVPQRGQTVAGGKRGEGRGMRS